MGSLPLGLEQKKQNKKTKQNKMNMMHSTSGMAQFTKTVPAPQHKQVKAAEVEVTTTSHGDQKNSNNPNQSHPLQQEAPLPSQQNANNESNE